MPLWEVSLEAWGGWLTPRSLQTLLAPPPPQGGRSRGAGLQRGPRHPDICRWTGRVGCGSLPRSQQHPGPAAHLSLLLSRSPLNPLRSSLHHFSPSLCWGACTPPHLAGTNPSTPLHSPPRPSPPSLIYLCISFLGNHQFPSVKQRRLPII